MHVKCALSWRVCIVIVSMFNNNIEWLCSFSSNFYMFDDHVAFTFILYMSKVNGHNRLLKF